MLPSSSPDPLLIALGLPVVHGAVLAAVAAVPHGRRADAGHPGRQLVVTRLPNRPLHVGIALVLAVSGARLL